MYGTRLSRNQAVCPCVTDLVDCMLLFDGPGSDWRPEAYCCAGICRAKSEDGRCLILDVLERLCLCRLPAWLVCLPGGVKKESLVSSVEASSDAERGRTEKREL